MKRISAPAPIALLPQLWNTHGGVRAHNRRAKLVRIEGPCDWRRHDGLDLTFVVIKGACIMRFRDRDILLGEGDLIAAPAGVEHALEAAEECWVMAIEKTTARNRPALVN